MTIYINWFFLDQPIRADVLNVNGTPAEDYAKDVVSGTPVPVPDHINYAEIVSDQNYEYSASNLQAIASDKKAFRFAGQCAQVFHITPGKTEITVTENP